MKVVLITPPYDKNRFRLGESLGLKYLAAVLRQNGVEVFVFEPALLDYDVQNTVEVIIEHGCDLLGISVQFSHGLPNAIEVMKGVKAIITPHITIGGHFATFHYDQLLEKIPQLDSVVMFEGEETLIELVRHLNEPLVWSNIQGLAYRDRATTVRRTPPRPLIRNLDSLPFPERDVTSHLAGDPHYGMISSRGCLLCCSFCSVPFYYDEPIGPRWRVRSPQNVVDEMEMLIGRCGAQEISFFDDNFIGSNRFGRKRAVQIAQEILDRHLNVRWSIECRVDDVTFELLETLKEAGLRHVNLGIESGDQSVLDSLKKLTTVEENRRAIDTVREIGLSAYYHFIMFNPDTTHNQLETSLNFIRERGIGSFSVVSNRLDVYKGTALFYRLEREDRLTKKGYEYGFRFSDPTIELIYETIHGGLLPLYEVEVALQRASFNEDVSASCSCRYRHLPASERTKAIGQLNKMLSDRTVEMVLEIVRYFLQHQAVEESNFPCFVRDFYVESKRFSKTMLNELAKLFIREVPA